MNVICRHDVSYCLANSCSNHYGLWARTQACTRNKLLAGVQFMATSATNNNNFIFPKAPLKKEYMMFHRELVSFDSINNFIFTERSI